MRLSICDLAPRDPNIRLLPDEPIGDAGHLDLQHLRLNGLYGMRSNAVLLDPTVPKRWVISDIHQCQLFGERMVFANDAIQFPDCSPYIGLA